MTLSQPLLPGSKAVVFGGGGGGIGRSITLALAAAGADVAIVDVSDAAARPVAVEAEAFGGRTSVLVGDIRSEGDVDRTVREAVDDLGGLDILVTVVGGARMFGLPSALIHEMTDRDIDIEIDVNLRYVFRVVRSGVKVMLEQGRGGSIVSIGSIAGGGTGYPDRPAYGAAKAGLNSLARSVAVEYGPHGIRMNVVAPGFIATPATPDDLSYDGVVPLYGRRGDPDDIAAAVLFFASPMAKYVSGQVLAVDGAATACFTRRETPN